MEIGTEISQKIRSAIKAKLVELGAYVDEELPDYIMVMVANKKSLKQMTDDLELFLAAKTDVFTKWLHELLKKLQSIGGEPKKDTNTTESHQEQVTVPVEVEPPTTTVEHQPDKDKKNSKHKEERELVVKDVSKEETVTPVKIEPKDDEEEGEIVADTPPEQTALVLEEEEPELLVRADTDEFSEELQLEEEKNKAKCVPIKSVRKEATSKSTLQSAVKHRPVTEVSRPAVLKKPLIIPTRQIVQVDSQSEKRLPITSRLGTKPDSRPRAIAAPIEQAPSASRQVAVSRKRRTPSSVVGHVINNNAKEEEYDPLNPAVGSVASVVKVTSRKSSVPRALQANKSLLMRAVNEAEKSVTVKKNTANSQHRPSQMVVRPLRREEPPTDEPVVKQGKLELTSRSRRQDIYRSMKFTIDNEPESPKYVIRKEEAYQPEFVGKRTDNRVVEYIPQPVTIKEEVDSDDDDDVIEIIQPEKPDTPITLEDEEEQQQLYIEKLVPAPRTIKNKLVLNPKFVVTLDGVDPEEYDGETDGDITMSTVTPETPSSRVNPPQVKHISINLKDSDDEGEDDEDVEMTPLVQAKATERCKFWPACVNGNACQYHHPTLPCKTFPHCKFADKCLYIHPNCKYDAKCSRPDCPYTHASRRSASAAPTIPQVLALPRHQVIVAAAPSVFQPQSTSTKKQCLYYPNCSNMNCPFYHPVPCRFGLSCRNKFCTYFHPHLPTKDKLKWSAQKPSADGPVDKNRLPSAVS